MTSSFLATIADDMFDRSQATAWAVFQVWTLQLEGIARVVDASQKVLFASCTLPGPSWAMSSEDRQTPTMPDTDVAGDPAQHLGYLMYNLYKAKAEIDAVAKHTTDLAAHVLAKSSDVDAKLESFKIEIMNMIDAKFAELEHTILGGDDSNIQTSAVDDLGAKISLLVHGPVEQPIYVDSYNNNNNNGTHSHSDDNWNQPNHYN